MKVILSSIITLLLATTLSAQNYVADEFIVEYVEDATAAERQAVRDLFGITEANGISDNIELWSDIAFPLTVTEAGETTVIDDVEGLLYYINIQEGGVNENSSSSAVINNGDPNYLLTLLDEGVIHEDGTFDPLPFCDDELNDRLIGPEIKMEEEQSTVSVIIVDQEITSSEVEIIPYATTVPYNLETPTGTHGNKVFSIINNQLTQAGITNVNYYNLVVFGNDGIATYRQLLEAFAYISVSAYNAGYTSELQNSIMNFSANMVIIGEESSLILWDYWEDFLLNHNVLLITSAGNQGLDTDNIFPAANNWSNEISVAGTGNCNKHPWINSNANPSIFEIATEAENILVHDGENYRLVNGTSFSSALVTGAAAQLAARCPGFDPLAIKNQLLAYADQNPNLENLVTQGRTLNVTRALENWENCSSSGSNPPPSGPGGLGGISPLQSSGASSPLTLSTSPNPFSRQALVTIELPAAGDVTVSVYNMMGQRVHQELIYNPQEMRELEWPTPNQLPPGTYLLRVQAGEDVEQLMLVKQ